MLCPLQTIRRSETNQRGFTLIEIMIAVVILGIVAALAIPNFMMMYARHELYQTTTDLYNRLVFTRSAAITRNAMLVANPPVVTAFGQTQIPFTAPLSPETLPLNVGVLLFPAQPVGFNPRGLSTTPLATQTIQLQSVRSPNLIYTISLAPSGKVAWCTRQVNPCLTNSN